MISLRWLFLGLVVTTTASVTSQLWNVLRVDGLTGTETLFLVLVTILSFWISISFWLTGLGAYALWRDQTGSMLSRPRTFDPRLRASPSRTAILFPIRNEETGRLFAGVAAVLESVRDSGVLDRFDFFLLSDSAGEVRLASEQRAFLQLRAAAGRDANLYYRHRTENVGRKSGNIAEFCENWGRHYDYMVVLDADSLMTAETLITVVRLMDVNPRTALIQVSPQLVGRESLFARLQQFASSVYGPLYTAGLALLQGADGNYWGHNAIIRVRPFMEHCGLPKLPGRAPLGGEIMSHDFVEASLLRRAEWELHLATELGGSYEEPPPTLIDHLKRDRRWCQGNLQHMRLIFAQGFRLESRGHLASGVMSYLSSPLWLLLTIASVMMMLGQKPITPVSYVGRYPVLSWPVSHAIELIALVSVMAIMLYVPKIFALSLLLRDREARRAHGGGWKAAISVLLESIFSTLLAPIAMLSQSMFVASILLGSATGWGGQQRSECRQDWSLIARAFAVHTVVAVLSGILIYHYLPGSFWWFVPLLSGPVLAIPLARLVGSSRVGRWTRRCGLFVTPCETGRVPIVDRVRLATECAAA